MIVFVRAVAAIAAVAGARTVSTVAKDGFGRIPTRPM